MDQKKRDQPIELMILGEQVSVSRVGTDNDVEEAKRLYRQLDEDPAVTAIGVGGADCVFTIRDRKPYVFKAVDQITSVVKGTPIVDGTGLKLTREPQLIRDLAQGKYKQSHGITIKGKKVLMVSAVDRYAMAKELEKCCESIVFGDLMFALKVPIAIRDIKWLDAITYVALPVIAGYFPKDWVYPQGKKQEETTPKWQEYYKEADIIAGDYHFIGVNAPTEPGSLEGKMIITNTTTEKDAARLKELGVKYRICLAS